MLTLTKVLPALISSGSFTGSFYGTSSYSKRALTASYAMNVAVVAVEPVEPVVQQAQVAPAVIVEVAALAVIVAQVVQVDPAEIMVQVEQVVVVLH